MGKAKFIYINEKDSISDESFIALRLSKSDKRKLYPQWSDEEIKHNEVYYPKCYGGDNEVFVSGIGYKKFGKTNKVIIPKFSGNVEDWDDYLNKYGQRCLFYSLTGHSLDSMDCCIYSGITEFYSILQCVGGIEHYQKFVDNVKAIQEIQKKVYKEKLSYKTEYGLNHFINGHLFRPSYHIMIISTPPYLDAIDDDMKMEEYYRNYRHHEIREEHPEYTPVQICEIIDKEFKEDDNDESDGGIFPCSMKERIKFLFGEECERLYKEILDEFIG